MPSRPATAPHAILLACASTTTFGASANCTSIARGGSRGLLGALRKFKCEFGAVQA